MRLHFIVGAAALLLIGTGVGAHAEDHCGMSNGKKATGEPIQLGAIVGKTGPEDFSSAARAAEAYFKCVNANGGINGRPIVYTVQDDNWNPEVAAQAASKLVKDTKIVGAVGSTSFVECGANNKLYEEEGVPVIAGVGVPRACFYAKNYAPFNEGPRLSTLGAAQYLIETFKLKSITCVAPGIPGFGDWVCNGVETYAKANGVASTTVIFDPGKLDGNAIALQIAASKPEAVVLGMPRGMMLPILTAAEQQDLGKTAKWGSADLGLSQPDAQGGRQVLGRQALRPHGTRAARQGRSGHEELEGHHGEVWRPERSDRLLLAGRPSRRAGGDRRAAQHQGTDRPQIRV